MQSVLKSASPFATCALETRRLDDALRALERASDALRLKPLAGREWYESLHRKLLPQLADHPYIVAAVVGGTNTGKSVIFNHLAGEHVSATSPLASGTRHPVCLVPEGFENEHDLAAIFPSFRLIQWTDPAAALENAPEHRLFWKTSPVLPSNLLILDTPDIDSDAEINWLRADHLRHCADVLVAVLTQQKYNDAEVKRFFRKAAGEDKAVIALFNQCLLAEDEPYWPLWLGTFSRETGVVPDLTYLAPNDRRAAEANQLPFFERQWRADDSAPASIDTAPHNLARDLSDMRFLEIKMRTLRGAFAQVLDPPNGAPAYLEEIRLRSAAFRDANEMLSTQQLARIDNWPAPPVSLLVNKIRQWWRSHRQGWTKTIHDVYGSLTGGFASTFRWAKRQFGGRAPDPCEIYKTAEYNQMLQVVESVYNNLTALSQFGNDLLRPRLETLLAGAPRTELFATLTATHGAVDINEELDLVVAAQMQVFREENPKMFGMLRKLDSAAAVARPVTSVVLFAAGPFGPLGHIAGSAGTQILVDIGAGTTFVVAGETALSGTAGGLRLLEARFRQLQAAFTARRVAWFAEFLREHILGDLHAELAAAAGVTEQSAYREVQACLERLSALVSEVTTPATSWGR